MENDFQDNIDSYYSCWNVGGMAFPPQLFWLEFSTKALGKRHLFWFAAIFLSYFENEK